MQPDLDTLFPPAPAHARSVDGRGLYSPIAKGEWPGANTGGPRKNIPTRWRAICSLEMRGHDKTEIAAALGLAYITVINITRRPEYNALRDELLSEMDNEFISMKPLALAALKGGLNSRDEQTALRASDQWFKAAAYGGYSRNPQPDRTVTAEDVAASLLQQINVNVNVNVSKDDT